MELDDYLRSVGFNILYLEGHSGQLDLQKYDLARLVNRPGIKNVMEIGFNAGHSADTFLKSNPDINLVSFDLGYHKYLPYAKKFIDEKYPGRHKLILGNSLETLPKFVASGDKILFDLIFIDGGHDYDVPKSDMAYSLQLCHPETIIIMDDYILDKRNVLDFNHGPNKAWNEKINDETIIELGCSQYGVRNDRGMVWGKLMPK